VADYSFGYIAPTGIWVHLVFVGTAAGTQLYTNGLFQSAIAASIPLPMANLGSDPLGDRLKGLIDELAVYNRALSPVEIQRLYDAGGSGRCITNPFLTNISKAGNSVTLTWLAQRGFTYRVQHRPSLNPDTPWINLDGDVTADGNSAAKTDATLSGSAQRFYRVLLSR
jgi:hypothetical protein